MYRNNCKGFDFSEPFDDFIARTMKQFNDLSVTLMLSRYSLKFSQYNCYGFSVKT